MGGGMGLAGGYGGMGLASGIRGLVWAWRVEDWRVDRCPQQGVCV